MRPRPGAGDAEVAAHLEALQEKAAGRDAHGILELALTGEFAGKTAVVSSFGAESAVLLKLVAEIDPNTPILFLNTGKLFGETLRYRDRLQDVLGLGDVRSLAPIRTSAQHNDPEGTLWSQRHRCLLQFPQDHSADPRAGAVRGPDHRPQALPDP